MRPPRSRLSDSLRSGIAGAWRRSPGPRDRLPTQSLEPFLRSLRLRGDANEPPLVRDATLQRVESVLLAAEEPITPRKLVQLADLTDTGEARRMIAKLNEWYQRDGTAFYVEEVAGGYQMLTLPDLRPWLEQVSRTHDELQLSGPTLETLAIVAYRQPICRADIEAIRGVQVGELLKQLMDKGLVRYDGRDESLGRPFLYGTTKRFLQLFGLRNLHELPLVELLAKPTAPAVAPQTEPTANEE